MSLKISVSWAWGSSFWTEFFVKTRISRTRFFNSITWNWGSSETRRSIKRISICRNWTISCIVTIWWITVYGKMKVVPLDVFASGMSWNFDWRTLQAIPIEKNIPFFVRFFVVFENSLKQSDLIHDKIYRFSDIQVFLLVQSVVCVKRISSIWTISSRGLFYRLHFWCYNFNFQWWIKSTNFFICMTFSVIKTNQFMKCNGRCQTSGCMFDLQFMNKAFRLFWWYSSGTFITNEVNSCINSCTPAILN